MVGYTLLILYLEYLLYIGCIERNPGPVGAVEEDPQYLNIILKTKYNNQNVILEEERHQLHYDHLLTKSIQNRKIIIKQSKQILFDNPNKIISYGDVRVDYNSLNYDWTVTITISRYSNSFNRRKMSDTNQKLLKIAKSNHASELVTYRMEVERNRNKIKMQTIKSFSHQNKLKYLSDHSLNVFNTMNRCVYNDCWKRFHTDNGRKLNKKYIRNLITKCSNNSRYRNNCIYNLLNNNISCDPVQMKYHIGGVRVCKHCWCDTHAISDHQFRRRWFVFVQY